jgi:hypothetical protein
MSIDEKEPSATPMKDETASALKDTRFQQAIKPSADPNLRKIVSTHPSWFVRLFYGLIGFVTQLTTPKPKAPKRSWLQRRADRYNARQHAAEFNNDSNEHWVD